MDGMGKKGVHMYKFVDERECSRYKNDCSYTLKETCKILKNKGITAQFVLVGSGARNLVTRNGNGPYDLDYNLIIIKALEKYWSDLKLLKETIRNALNKAIGGEWFSDAQDSTSCLTTILHFNDSPEIEFSFDVAIICKKSNGQWLRLVHNKNIWGIGYDQFTWNEVPYSADVKRKADELKYEGLWLEVRETYLRLKNMYLMRMDKTHPSFTVYVQAVNEVYNKYWRN